MLQKGEYHMGRISSEQRNIGKRLKGITMPIRRKRIRWQRNWPCLCGSNKKYKKCCMPEMDQLTATDGNGKQIELPAHIQKICDEHQKLQLNSNVFGKKHDV